MAKAGLAADKKEAKRQGSPIVFLDETGFMLQPVSGTYSPSGQVPVQWGLGPVKQSLLEWDGVVTGL